MLFPHTKNASPFSACLFALKHESFAKLLRQKIILINTNLYGSENESRFLLKIEFQFFFSFFIFQTTPRAKFVHSWCIEFFRFVSLPYQFRTEIWFYLCQEREKQQTQERQSSIHRKCLIIQMLITAIDTHMQKREQGMVWATFFLFYRFSLQFPYENIFLLYLFLYLSLCMRETFPSIPFYSCHITTTIFHYNNTERANDSLFVYCIWWKFSKSLTDKLRVLLCSCRKKKRNEMRWFECEMNVNAGGKSLNNKNNFPVFLFCRSREFIFMDI